MLHFGVIVVGAYFCLVSLWSVIHLTARYYHFRQRHTDFKTSLTFPCCNKCKAQPKNGIIKIAFSFVCAILELALDKGYAGSDAFVSSSELATILFLLVLSGMMDILAQWGSRTFYQHLNFAGLTLFFTATAAILESHASITPLPMSSVHRMAAYAAFASAVATVLEGLFPDQILYPLIRCHSILLQGTWWAHAAFMLRDNPLLDGADVEMTANAMMFLSVVFCGHVALDLVVILCLWLLVGKLTEKNLCRSFGGGDNVLGDDVVLENRVRFNYHVLTRFDSETE